MSESDFEVADREAGATVMGIEDASVARRGEVGLGKVPANVMQYREELIREYHGGLPSLLDRLRSEGKDNYEDLIVALYDEIVKESDNLLGNGLVATHNGDLRDASVISVKRAEIIEKALRAVSDKQKFEQSRGTFDVDSAAMLDVFRFFMSKAKETLVHMGVDSEMNDLFFQTFAEIAANWKKELKEKLSAVKGDG